MSTPQPAKVLLFAALLIAANVEIQAKPARGLKRSFGMGLLGGAVAGAVIGNAVAKAPGSSKAAAPAAPPVAQVVETGATDANGCYRQTVKEPVAGKPKLYTETVTLVCPQATPVAHPQPAVMVPVQVLPAAHGHVQAAAQPALLVPAVNGTQVNATHTQAVQVQPGPAPVARAAPPSTLTVVYAAPPAPQAPQPAPPGTAHVILLSKTVKKQKSAAASVNISRGLLVLMVLYCLLRK